MTSAAGLPAVATSREPLQGRRRWRRIMMLTATSFFLVAACTADTDPPVSYTPPPLKPHEVVYAADGEGTTSASYTWSTEDGGTAQGTIDLPLKDKDGNVGITSNAFKSGAFLYLSIQNSEGFGSVTCQIIVDGVEVTKVTSSGGYVIATCQGKVP